MYGQEANPIRSEGLDVPLLALYDKPHGIVLGGRRLSALKARMRGTHRIPVMVANTAGHVAAWLKADAEVAGWRGPGQPWTWAQRGRVYLAIMAAIRPNPSRGEPSLAKALAAYFGVHEIQLRNAGYLLREFDKASDRDTIRRYATAIAEVEDGTLLPQTAMRRLAARIGWHPGADQPPPTVTADEQARMLAALSGQLSGLLIGLEQMGAVHPDLTPEQRAELYPPLAKFRRVLTRVTRQLNTGGQQDDQNDQD